MALNKLLPHQRAALAEAGTRHGTAERLGLLGIRLAARFHDYRAEGCTCEYCDAFAQALGRDAPPRCAVHEVGLANEAFFKCGCRYIRSAVGPTGGAPPQEPPGANGPGPSEDV